MNKPPCKNPAKKHLWKLPNLPLEDQKLGQLTAPDEAGILCIYPIFSTHPKDDSMEHHILRSALWSRLSMINNTDAAEMGVKTLLYIEDKIADRAITYSSRKWSRRQ